MREFVEKKLKRGGYTNIAAANFPCGVWIKEDTKLYAVCLFDDPNKLAADPWRIDRVVDYAAQKVREQKQLECQFLALVLSDDFSISKQLVTGFYPRWFIDDAGQPVIFDGQPSEFCDLYATLIRKERFSDRFNGKRIEINRIPEVTLMLVILNILIHFGWDHLFNNMLVLLYLGALAERCIGKWRFLGVYLISGIGANAASVWWYVHQGDLLIATAGASGAIFGIAGLLLCIVLLSKGHFEEITLRQLIFMMFFTLYHGFAESGVNNCAHIVGAIIGFVCGIIIFCQMKKNRAEGR